VTSYNMTAVPNTSSGTITINNFNSTNINFTANFTSGTNVTFTIWSLKPDTYYLIKRDGVECQTIKTNSSGYLTFWNDEWSERTFTVEEYAETTTSTTTTTTTTVSGGGGISPTKPTCFDGIQNQREEGIDSTDQTSTQNSNSCICSFSL